MRKHPGVFAFLAPEAQPGSKRVMRNETAASTIKTGEWAGSRNETAAGTQE
jgi:hypothetical protein